MRQSLGFVKDQDPIDPRVERTWRGDGVDGEEVSWSVGYGAKDGGVGPASSRSTGPSPRVVALHDHAGFKFYGKEKIADGPEMPAPFCGRAPGATLRRPAFANELARQGFAVLVHGTPSCGEAAASNSRKWPRLLRHRKPLGQPLGQ